MAGKKESMKRLWLQEHAKRAYQEYKKTNIPGAFQ